VVGLTTVAWVSRAAAVIAAMAPKVWPLDPGRSWSTQVWARVPIGPLAAAGGGARLPEGELGGLGGVGGGEHGQAGEGESGQDQGRRGLGSDTAHQHLASTAAWTSDVWAR
jgi:hypothetical protein